MALLEGKVPGGQPLEKGVKARLLIGSTVENISFNFATIDQKYANIWFRGIFQVFLINFRKFYIQMSEILFWWVATMPVIGIVQYFDLLQSIKPYSILAVS